MLRSSPHISLPHCSFSRLTEIDRHYSFDTKHTEKKILKLKPPDNFFEYNEVNKTNNRPKLSLVDGIENAHRFRSLPLLLFSSHRRKINLLFQPSICTRCLLFHDDWAITLILLLIFIMIMTIISEKLYFGVQQTIIMLNQYRT